MPFNEQRFKWLVENVDPTPLYGSIMQSAQQMYAQQGDAPQAPYANMLGEELAAGAPEQGGGAMPGAPGGIPPAMLAKIAGQMQQGAPQAQPAPAAAPRMPQPIKFPSFNIPRGLQQVPDLRTLLGGIPGGSR